MAHERGRKWSVLKTGHLLTGELAQPRWSNTTRKSHCTLYLSKRDSATTKYQRLTSFLFLCQKTNILACVCPLQLNLSIVFVCLYLVQIVVPMGIYPMGNLGRFSPGKSAATESRYPTVINYKVHAGYFRVSVIHRTLTWTTGSLTCVRDYS